jgi:hypothetical protein
MNKEKYNKIVNSNLNRTGMILLAMLILTIIFTPMMIFPLTGILIWDIMLSIMLSQVFLGLIGGVLVGVIYIVVTWGTKRGKHNGIFAHVCLDALNKSIELASFCIKYFGGDW